MAYTMVNGRLYDAATMNETGNHEKKRGDFYWEAVKNAGSFPWYNLTDTETCTCGHQ